MFGELSVEEGGAYKCDPAGVGTIVLKSAKGKSECAQATSATPNAERNFFIDHLLVRIHFIIVMIV